MHTMGRWNSWVLHPMQGLVLCSLLCWYNEIVFSHYVVDFGGKLPNAGDQHQTPCHLFFFSSSSVSIAIFFSAMASLTGFRQISLLYLLWGFIN